MNKAEITKPCKDCVEASIKEINDEERLPVQTVLRRQASNGCQVTMHFREQRDEKIESSVADMQLAVFQRMHNKGEKLL